MAEARTTGEGEPSDKTRSGPAGRAAERSDGTAFDGSPKESERSIADASTTDRLSAAAGPAAREDRRERGRQRSLGWVIERRAWGILCAAVDIVLLYAGSVAALVGAPAAGVDPSSPSVWLLPPLAVLLLASRRAYRSELQIQVLDWVAKVVGAISLSAMILIAFDTLIDPGSPGAGLLVRAWLFGTLYVAAGRALLGMVKRRAQAHRLAGKRTIIVGSGRIGSLVERRLRTHPELGLIPIGYLDSDPVSMELAPGRRAPVLGAPTDVAQVAKEKGARHVIFAFTSTPDEALVPLVRECELEGVEVSLVPRLFDGINARVDLEYIGGLPLYGLRRVNPRGWEFAVKHLVGRSLAALLLVVLSPALLLVALGVRITSPGPILYRQLRVGRDGHSFELVKFRSIRVPDHGRGESGAEPSARAGDGAASRDGADRAPGGLEGEQRLTPIGGFIRRTSLDELPQLWNVVKGDMTLVGPRPERPEYVELFGSSVRRYDDRHRVKSGVTGWAQVHGLRGRTSLSDRVEWDNYYIENWSLGLDLKILLMTLMVPFRDRG